MVPPAKNSWNFRKKTEIMPRYFPLNSRFMVRAMAEDDFEQAVRLDLGRRIQLAYRKQRLTLGGLAKKAGYDEKTIRNVIRGERTRVGTIEDICSVLKIEIYADSSKKPATNSAVAPDIHGEYAKNHYEDYIGFYTAHRRSFTFPENILRSVYEIRWSDEKNCMIFYEHQKYNSAELDRAIDYSQGGDIYISNSINLIHMMTIVNGAVRLVTLTKMKVNDKTLRGIVLTQSQGEFYFQPSVSPIVLEKEDPGTCLDMLASQIGPIRPSDPLYGKINAALVHVQCKVANFSLGPSLPPGAAVAQVVA